MILIRCSQCKKYYSIKNDTCKCGNKDKTRNYVVRINNKDYPAGNSLAIAREIDAKIKKDRRLGKIDAYQKKERLAFKQYHDKYYESHYSTLRSALTMKYMVDYFVECFKNEYLDRITPASIKKSIIDKTGELSPMAILKVGLLFQPTK